MKKILTALFLCVLAWNVQAQTDIADVRDMTVGTTGITIEGIITSGDEFGVIRYIQDATAGIGMYDFGVTDGLNAGDIVQLTGELGEFGGAIQLINLTNVNVLSTGNPMPAAKVITPNEMPTYEAELVVINGATFQDGGSQFNGNTTYPFMASGENSIVFVRTSNPLVGTTIPGAANITGISSQYQGTPQILPRGPQDLVGNFIDNLDQDNISQTSFDITFETNFMGSTNFRYGTSADNLDQEITLGGSSMSHSVNLTGLTAGTIYYGQAYSSDGGSTTESPVRAFATASNSSGDIVVYFNNSIDGSVSSGVPALGYHGAVIESKIIDMLNAATETIDFCAYNNSRAPIVNALNDALGRGVQVRYIANNGTLNSALQNGAPDFPVLTANANALMHNKVIIIDANVTDKATVLTGSMNFTDLQIVEDYNHVIIFKDESMAKGFTLEFEEMWGSDGPDFNVFASKVGDQKTLNTPEKYMLDGVLVESHFTPAGNTANSIIAAMNSADNEMDFAILAFTRNDIRDAILDAHDNGVNIRGFIENTGDTGGEYDILVSNGVDVRDHPAPEQMHHKYAIIDAQSPGSDPAVVTGSYNWTSAAQSSNDENTVIVHDAVIANIFLQEFTARWLGQFLNVKAVPQIIGLEFSIAPNPIQSEGTLSIQTEQMMDLNMEIYDINGKVVQSAALGNINGALDKNINVSALSNGTYFLTLETNGHRVAQRFSVAR